MAIEDKQIGPWVLHEMLAEVINEEGDVSWLATFVGGRERNEVTALIVEQHLETAAVNGGQSIILIPGR